MRNVEGRATAILIVEDEALIRYDLVDFFEDAGFETFDAGDADEAIALLEREPEIRIVITDVHMPGSMDGIRLAHYVRDRYPPTLLVVASGVARPTAADLPDRALFVSKPFDRSAILREIEKNI